MAVLIKSAFLPFLPLKIRLVRLRGGWKNSIPLRRRAGLSLKNTLFRGSPDEAVSKKRKDFGSGWL